MNLRSGLPTNPGVRGTKFSRSRPVRALFGTRELRKSVAACGTTLRYK